MEDDSQRNLIINYLPNSLNATAFKNMFAPFGEIDSCRIIFDKLTGISQGYGFVKYKTNEAAVKAIEIMNGQVVDNKTLKVSLARPPGSMVADGSNPSFVGLDSNGMPKAMGVPQALQANLYVANLPKHYTKADLEQMFIPYGPILDTKILLDPGTGVSRGVGFVKFQSREQAQIAIDSLNGQIPLGADTPIAVRFSDTKEDKVRKGKAPPTSLYGGAVGGRMRYSPMAPSPAMPTQYGAGFGMYQTAPVGQDPSLYLQMQPDQMAAAQNFGVYQPAANPGLAYCLFVYNLPQDGDESLLYRLFGPFGAISDVKVLRDTNGRCKGFGFVHYLKLEDAQQAIISMNGYQVGNKFLQVSFKKQK